MTRYILTAVRNDRPQGMVTPTMYLTRRGFRAYNAKLAAVLSLADARAELDYHRRTAPLYRWQIEQLPPNKPLPRAVLCAEPIDP